MITFRKLAAVAIGVVVAACSSTGPRPGEAQGGGPAPVPHVTAGGYLTKDGRPDSLSLLPPPPAPGSEAQARDDAGARAAIALQGAPRWISAMNDANLALPGLAGDFSCALGANLSPQTAPRALHLLSRSMADLGLSTFAAKAKYKRPRPFTLDGAPICTPADDAVLRKDGSYPSGHSAIGWGWGLILAELVPDRADAVLARARAFGQSRVVCNVHWLSDVEEGRMVAAAVVAKLHGDPRFRADMEAARAELQALPRGSAAASSRCAAEAASFANG